MNDFTKAIKAVGNTFDFVLIVSERVREINRNRRAATLVSQTPIKKARPNESINMAVSDIESGVIGTDYLDKIVSRKKP